MKLNVDYDNLKKAIDIYDDAIDKVYEKKNKEYEIISELWNEKLLEKDLKLNFTPYRGKSKSQDAQIDLMETFRLKGNDEYTYFISSSGYIGCFETSKHIEDGKHVTMREKDCRRFGRYYRSLLNNVKTYDEEQDGTYDEGSIEEALKKNLSSGALGAASKNYRGLMKLYGKKKANSILKKLKKETGAKVVVKKKLAKVKNEKGEVVRTYNKYSIVAKKEKGSSKGSGASTGAKKTKKSKTKTVKKKKK